MYENKLYHKTMSENSNSNKDSKKLVFENLWHNSEEEERNKADLAKKLKSWDKC